MLRLLVLIKYWKDKFYSDDINDQCDHVVKYMIKLWNNWRGSMHKNIKSKPLRYALKDVPNGVEKRDWEWLVKEHFFTEKFKIKNLKSEELILEESVEQVEVQEVFGSSAIV